MVWYGLVWFGMVWFGMVWYGFGMGLVWFGMVWFGRERGGGMFRNVLEYSRMFQRDIVPNSLFFGMLPLGSQLASKS